MNNLRKYGNAPYSIVVIHGGPGAPGQVAPVARELSQLYGVLEPLHTANSIEGQIIELKNIIEDNTNGSVVLIGHSYGAWLSYIFASRYPQLVKKLILVGSGTYEEKYLGAINNRKIFNLTNEENIRIEELWGCLNDISNKNKNNLLSEFEKLSLKRDSFSPICLENEMLDFQPDVFRNCIKEVMCLIKSNKLLQMGTKISCPVIAIHGENDPNVFEGVEKTLSKVIKDFKFILLKKCGHYVWNESYAKDKFYKIMLEELNV